MGFFYESSQYNNAAEDISLAIMNIATKDIKTVYTGSYHTSRWEWNDQNHVSVYYNCGTCCMYVYRINVATGVQERAYHDEPYEQECIAPALKN